jgi:hypothetical protein
VGRGQGHCARAAAPGLIVAGHNLWSGASLERAALRRDTGSACCGGPRRARTTRHIIRTRARARTRSRLLRCGVAAGESETGSVYGHGHAYGLRAALARCDESSGVPCTPLQPFAV